MPCALEKIMVIDSGHVDTINVLQNVKLALYKATNIHSKVRLGFC